MSSRGIAHTRTAVFGGSSADRRSARRGSILPKVPIVVLAVLTIACVLAVAAVVARSRAEADATARAAAAYTPPPTTTGPTGGTSSVVVIGDEGVDEASGVRPGDRWPALLASSLRVPVVRFVSDGGGYATNGVDGSTFGDYVDRIPASAAVVVFFGGAYDAAVSRLSLENAVTDACAEARSRAPDVRIVVVGPLPRQTGSSSGDVADVRSALKAASRIARARYLDPASSQWGVDATAARDLTAADERIIAARIEPALRSGLR